MQEATFLGYFDRTGFTVTVGAPAPPLDDRRATLYGSDVQMSMRRKAFSADGPADWEVNYTVPSSGHSVESVRTRHFMLGVLLGFADTLNEHLEATWARIQDGSPEEYDPPKTARILLSNQTFPIPKEVHVHDIRIHR